MNKYQISSLNRSMFSTPIFEQEQLPYDAYQEEADFLKGRTPGDLGAPQDDE